MSDIDRDLRGLRDELTAAIPLPDVDDVTGRARARRRGQVVAIVAVVVAVAAAVPIARALPIWTTTASTNPAKTTYVVDFADADHGYALTRTCVRGTVGCASTLYQTADGGESWQARKLPRAPSDQFWDVLYVLGPDDVAIATPIGIEKTRIFSTDGGRSWGRVENPDTGVTEPVITLSLARGGMLTGGCGAQPFTGDACQVVGSIQPSTGRFVAAPTQPPLNPRQLGPAPTEGGKWWVAGTRDGSDHAWLAVSDDDGQTWSASEMAEFAGMGGWSVVEHGDTMFATAGAANGLFGVWRSTDGGRSWTRTWTYDPIAAMASGGAPAEDAPTEGPALVGGPVLAGDGKLIVSNGTKTYVSDDQGRHFRPAGADTGWVKWTRGGYLRMQGHSFALSADGTHWREFTVG